MRNEHLIIMRNEHLIKKIKEITKDLQNLTFNEKRQTVKEEISKFEHTVIYEGLEKLLQFNTPNEQIELLEKLILICKLEVLLKKIKMKQVEFNPAACEEDNT